MTPSEDIVVMTITSDGGDYPDVRLERIPLSAVDKSQILEEEVNGMVLYKPDYARITNEDRVTSQVRLDFEVVCDGRSKDTKRLQNRQLYLWYPESASYNEFCLHAETIFEDFIRVMPNDHKDYIIKVAKQMQKSPGIQKVISEVREEGIGTRNDKVSDTVTDDIKPEVLQQISVVEEPVVAEQHTVVTSGIDTAELNGSREEEAVVPLTTAEVVNPESKPLQNDTNNVKSLENKLNDDDKIDEIPETGKTKLRQKFRDTLLLIARTHKITDVLQQAYPNNLSFDEVSRLTGRLATEPVTVMLILNKLNKQGTIRELGKGRFMKVPEGKNHEIKLVKQLPYLTAKDQPTIGIITALYCEKIAVDAMMTNKISFVRYKTDGGESNVYTLGMIGPHRVVSTKLPTVGLDRSARISSGNTVTRLLGTFSQLDHVIMVGVAGATPDAHDVELGDIVISLPAGADSPQYVSCDNIVDDENEDVSFNVRNWASTEITFARVAGKVSSAAVSEKPEDQTWLTYYYEAFDILKEEQERSHFLNYDRPISDVDIPSAHFGAIGGGKPLMMDKNVRREFAKMTKVQAFDHHFDIVMDSIVGSRKDSFVIIRGVSDYVDGWEQTRWSGIAKWQPAAALAAAAYAKALIINYRPPRQ